MLATQKGALKESQLENDSDTPQTLPITSIRNQDDMEDTQLLSTTEDTQMSPLKPIPRKRITRTYGRRVFAEEEEKRGSDAPLELDDDVGRMDSGLMRLLDLPEDTFAETQVGTIARMPETLEEEVEDVGSPSGGEDEELEKSSARRGSTLERTQPSGSLHSAPKSAMESYHAMRDTRLEQQSSLKLTVMNRAQTGGESSAEDNQDDDMSVSRGRNLRINAMRRQTGAADSRPTRKSDEHEQDTFNVLNGEDPTQPPPSDTLTRTSAEVLSTLFGDISEDEVSASAKAAPISRAHESSGDDGNDAILQEHPDDVVDSDGNLLEEEKPPATFQQKIKSLSKKDKLELKKETERLLRSTVVEAPKRQSKFTVDQFLAGRGIVRKAAIYSQPRDTLITTDTKITTESLHPKPVDSAPSELSRAASPMSKIPSTNVKQPPAAASSKPASKKLPFKTDSVVTRAELRAIAENNAAVSRGLILRADLEDGDFSDDDDDDMLEVVEVRDDEKPQQTSSQKLPSSQRTRKYADLNQQLIERNQRQARARRMQEEEAARAAAEERQKRKEDKRNERRAAKEKKSLEREHAKTEDHGIVHIEAGMEVDPPVEKNDAEDRTDENNVAKPPPMRRLFSEDRTPFAELFRREETADQDDPMLSNEETGVGSDSENIDVPNDEAVNIDDLQPSSPQQSASKPLKLNYSYTVNMDDIPDLSTHVETEQVSPVSSVPDPKSKMGRMKAQDNNSSGPPPFASIFQNPGDVQATQSPPAEISSLEISGFAVQHDDDLTGSALGELAAPPRFASIFGNRAQKKAMPAAGAVRGSAQRLRKPGDELHHGAQQKTQSSLGRSEVEPADHSEETPQSPAEEQEDNEEDPFAALLRDDSDDDREDGEDLSGRQQSRQEKRARRFVDSDEEQQPHLPAVSRVIPPQVVKEGDDDDRESVASSQVTDEEIGPESQELDADAGGGSAENGEEHADDDAVHRPASVLLAQQPPRERNAFVETEAFEEEDEFFGLGGADGEDNGDNDAALDQDLKDLVVSDDSDVEGFADVMELHRQQAQQDHEKGITELLNDVTTGNLRKRKARRSRNGGGGFIEDSDEDDDLLLAKIRGKHWVRDHDAEPEEPGLISMAVNPETKAFAKCFENTCSVKDGFLSSDEDLRDEDAPKVNVLRTYGRKKSDESGREADESGEISKSKAMRAKFPRFGTWPLAKNDEMVMEEQADEEDPMQVIDIDGPGETAEEGLMEVDRLGVDVLKMMQERKKAAIGGMLGDAPKGDRVNLLTRTQDSTRIFRKRSFLEDRSPSASGTQGISSTSPTKKKKMRHSSSMSGFGALEKSNDAGGGRRGMGFKIGVAPPLLNTNSNSSSIDDRDASSLLAAGMNSNAGGAAAAKKKRVKAEQQNPNSKTLGGFLSRQTSFR
ncbi:MRC1-like domain-containing protein [Powellomyces hirtus]|nr:MRC1-like domain-containing protein [Powellomyces hirtus]